MAYAGQIYYFRIWKLSRAWQMRRYVIMQGTKSPIAVGSTKVQQVEPIPLEPTGNSSNGVGWHESTFGRTTTAKIMLLSEYCGSRHLTSHRAVFSTWTL